MKSPSEQPCCVVLPSPSGLCMRSNHIHEPLVHWHFNQLPDQLLLNPMCPIMQCTFKTAINIARSLWPSACTSIPSAGPPAPAVHLCVSSARSSKCMSVGKQNSISPPERRIQLGDVRSEESLHSAVHCLQCRDTWRDIRSDDVQATGNAATAVICMFSAVKCSSQHWQ